MVHSGHRNLILYPLCCSDERLLAGLDRTDRRIADRGCAYLVAGGAKCAGAARAGKADCCTAYAAADGPGVALIAGEGKVGRIGTGFGADRKGIRRTVTGGIGQDSVVQNTGGAVR